MIDMMNDYCERLNKGGLTLVKKNMVTSDTDDNTTISIPFKKTASAISNPEQLISNFLAMDDIKFQYSSVGKLFHIWTLSDAAIYCIILEKSNITFMRVAE